jgi:TatD DNase family protein
MKLSDTHCHLDLYPNPQAVAAAAERARVRTIAVTNAPSVFRRSAQLTHGCEHLRTALGLHPQLAAQRKHEVALFKQLVGETRYIGEVGLDFSTSDAADRRAQQDVFEEILATCAHRGKVLTVHSRRAADETLDALGSGAAWTVILHWFTGSQRALDRAASIGCFFSVNAGMLRSAAGARIVAALPLDRVLLESDGPFVQVDGRPATPMDGARIVEALARLWGVPAEDAASRTYANLNRALTSYATEPRTT